MELSSDSEEEDVHSPPVYTLSDGEEDGENEVPPVYTLSEEEEAPVSPTTTEEWEEHEGNLAQAMLGSALARLNLNWIELFSFQ